MTRRILPCPPTLKARRSRHKQAAEESDANEHEAPAVEPND
jgi:hypothetical protein